MPLSRSAFLTDQTARWQARLQQAVRDPRGLMTRAPSKSGAMQIKLGMAPFRCDNYGFICKLSLRLMLRDIKNKLKCEGFTDDDVFWFLLKKKRKRKTCDSHDAEGCRYAAGFRQRCASEASLSACGTNSRCFKNIYMYLFGYVGKTWRAHISGRGVKTQR